MKKFIASIFFLGLGAACASSLTQRDPSNLAPKGANKGKIGRVVYNPAGLDPLVELRRNEALRLIVNICGSNDYETLSETVMDPKHIQGGIAMLGATTAHVISYKCR